ncbi:MAG: universal stress protein [Saprospiraceae bacterium]|nr:universal stress protein [Saprospiraceae bacterium]
MENSAVPYKVESIVDVDQFLNEGIHSIPTVVIQTEVKLEQRQYKDKQSFSDAVKKISSKMSSIVSKKIIVPTDFSETADNAIKYGAELAKNFEGGLEIVHILNPATDLNTGYMIDPGIEKLKREKLEKITQKVSEDYDIRASSRFILGFPIEELANLSAESDVLLVVGATGESDILENVFGSVASHLAQRAKSPVLIVPKGVEFTAFKEVVYASNDPGLDHKIANLVKNFVSHFDSRLHSVHIGKDESYPQWQMEAIFGGKDAVPELLISHMDEKNVVEALNKYCEKAGADLVILSTRQRGFWRTLVHSSITREMALHPHLPLLVFHDAKKA